MNLEEQPRPSESKCPECGEEPTDDSIVEHRLSALAYTHDDQILECEKCSNQWTLGVPIGEPEEKKESELWCDSCEKRFMRVHFIDVNPSIDEDVKLHLKCPNVECRYYKWFGRDTDRRGVIHTRYPDISGSEDGADPYGK